MSAAKNATKKRLQLMRSDESFANHLHRVLCRRKRAFITLVEAECWVTIINATNAFEGRVSTRDGCTNELHAYVCLWHDHYHVGHHTLTSQADLERVRDFVQPYLTS